MIFANRTFEVETYRLKTPARVKASAKNPTDYYNLRCIRLGAAGGPSTKQALIPVASQVGQRLVGLRKDLALGPTHTSRPRINHQKSPELFLILSGCQFAGRDARLMWRDPQGAVLVPPGQSLELIESGYSFMQRWSECIVKAQPGDVFCVNIASETNGRVWTGYEFYLVGHSEVIAIDQYSAYETYVGLLDALRLPRPQWLTDCGFQTTGWDDVLYRRRVHRDLIRTDTRFREI